MWKQNFVDAELFEKMVVQVEDDCEGGLAEVVVEDVLRMLSESRKTDLYFAVAALEKRVLKLEEQRDGTF